MKTALNMDKGMKLLHAWASGQGGFRLAKEIMIRLRSLVMRGDKLTRQLRLLHLLDARPDGVEVEEAAEELGRGRRTVYRDFEVLQSSGVPLVVEREGKRARWRMMEGYRHRLQLSLTWSEVLALSTGSELMAGLAGTVFHESAVSALEKIRATLPRAVSERVRSTKARLSTSSGGHDYAARGRLLELLIEAIDRRRTVMAKYRTGGAKAALRRMDPYHLQVTDQAIYVIAYCHRTSATKTFLLDRFDGVTPTGEPFEISREFRPDAFTGGAFGMWAGAPRRVRFNAAPAIARLFLERKVHPSQVAQRRADGSVDVVLEVAPGPPLVAWLAGFGAALERLEPAELRERVEAVHRDAAAKFSKNVRPRLTQRRGKR